MIEVGTVDLVLDGGRHALAAGDAVTFDADLQHHFENTSDRVAAFLSVVTLGFGKG